MSEQVLTTREIAASLGVLPALARRIVESGELPGERRGRTVVVPRAAFERWWARRVAAAERELRRRRRR